MSKPKLELQVNIPTTVRLLQSQPATGENAYGQWWLYSVESEGVEYSYFAPEQVVNKLQQLNIQEDDEVVITKKLMKKGKNNTVTYEISDPVKTSEETESNENVNTNGNGFLNGKNGNGHTENVLSKDYNVMLEAMNEAMMIRDELGGDVDVNKLGVTLFIKKAKA